MRLALSLKRLLAGNADAAMGLQNKKAGACI